jgi:flavin-dependent dehydrogenase
MNNLMNKLYDVIIIGGGPTGSSAATFLRREGLSVLILEKMKFPREHVGESMLPLCYDLFDELGVLEEMKVNYSRKPGVTFSNADGTRASHWCFSKVIDGPQSLSFHARRSHFDNMLLNNSRKEGVDALEEVQVLDVELNPSGQGVKIKALHPEKGNLSFEGRFLIDASGQDCFLARKMGNQKPFNSLNVRLALSSHWENANLTDSLSNGNITIIHFGGEKLGWIWLIPLAENRLSIGLALNMSYAQEQRKILMKEHGPRKWQEVFYLQEISESEVVRGIIDGANMCWDVVSNGDFSYYAEQKYGPAFAILGDAGAFLDPIFSSGIYLGIKSAKISAPAIASYLQSGDMEALDKVYEYMNNGYKVVEDLIVAFYDPNTINFTELSGSSGISHEQFEAAYTIYHMLLAGDFYDNHDRYRKAIASLRNPAMIKKYLNLKQHEDAEGLKEVCTIPEPMLT